MIKNLTFVGVRRWGEDEETPVVIDGRKTCGAWSDHRRLGCIGLHVAFGGASGLIHLTSADALRLADLLRAMAEANADGAGP